MLGDFRADEGHPMYWPCDQCQAGGQEPCRTRTGERAKGFHRDRLESVRLWKRYGRHNGTGVAR